jgi:uncharacterized protein (DUF305 family)
MKNNMIIQRRLTRLATIGVIAFGVSLGLSLGQPLMLRAQTAMDHGAMAGHGAHDAIDPAARDYQAAMAKMHKDMAVKPSGSPDVDFVQGMIPHHQGAIDMAKTELKYGTDPEIRRLAQGVIDAQEKEIAMMRGWLANHKKP